MRLLFFTVSTDKNHGVLIMLNNEESGQVSAEMILLLAGIIMIVIIVTTSYKDYLTDFSEDIQDNEVKNLKNKIDDLNNLLKKIGG